MQHKDSAPLLKKLAEYKQQPCKISPHVLIAEVWGLYDLGDLRVGGVVGDRDLWLTLRDLCFGGGGVHDGDSYIRSHVTINLKKQHYEFIIIQTLLSYLL